MTTTYARYTLGRGVTFGPQSAGGPLEPAAGPLGPVASVEEALERSYPLARRANPMLSDSYHFGEAHPSASGGWSASWFSLEFTAFGRGAGARVEFAPDGSSTVHRGWVPVPRMRAP